MWIDVKLGNVFRGTDGGLYLHVAAARIPILPGFIGHLILELMKCDIFHLASSLGFPPQLFSKHFSRVLLFKLAFSVVAFLKRRSSMFAAWLLCGVGYCRL